MMTDAQGMSTHGVWLENPPVSARQRKLFNRLLWHAVAETGPGNGYAVDMGPLAELLEIRGAVETRLLLACGDLARTRVRWRIGGSEEERGFCPLLAQCWCAGGMLHYTFPGRLEGFIRSGDLFDELALRMDDLFRSAKGAVLYEHLKPLAEVETGGWQDNASLSLLLGLKPATLDGSALETDIIEPALEEINDLTELQVAAVYRRSEAGIEAVKFRVRRKASPATSCLHLPGAGGAGTPQARMDAFEAHKAEQVCALTQEMDEMEIKAIQGAFLDRIRGNAVLMAKYEKDGFDALAIKLSYEVFLEEMLLTEEQRDFMRFNTGLKE
jgi:hypothetical protein